MSMSTTFSRIELSSVLEDVRAHVPGVRLRDAWVWKCGKDHWEFHYTDSVPRRWTPEGSFYWHGSADNAYEARSKGWTAFLEKLGVEGYAR